MGARTVLASATARRQWRALIGLAALLAIGLGVSLAATAVAARTDRAYDAYLDRADVGDVVVNPALATRRAAAIIAETPGVRSVVSDDLLTATLDDGEPRTQAQVDSGFVQLRTSDNGRYVTQDRPVILAGRMAQEGAEAVVSRETAELCSTSRSAMSCPSPSGARATTRQAAPDRTISSSPWVGSG